MSHDRAKKIKVILFDVDGVLTDGTIWLVPAPGASPGPNIVEAKGFHAHDGTGISLPQLAGIKIGIITKRSSETVALRARALKLDFVYQGIADKLGTFREICSLAGVRPEEVAFVGDDVIDLPVMRKCGFAIAVPNAREEVKDEAHLITERKGGEGAARDAIEYILRAQGRFEAMVSEYIQEGATPEARKK